MREAACAGGLSLHVQEVLCRWAPAYRQRFDATMPPRHREVLDHLQACRTPALGGSLHYCPTCGTHHYTYHSCNDRHCPQCGHTDADQWLAEHTALLLPVGYFLVTFTVPEPLRAWMRSHPTLAYRALFAASAQALQDLARNPRRLGATLGMLGILHTWTRTLVYHPHVHYLVPAGGLSPDGRRWVSSRGKFFLPVKPLSDRFRTRLRQALERQAPEGVKDLPARIWKQRWVTHCKAVGSGQPALRYLSRYVFQTATGNRRLTLLPNDRLRWPYRQRSPRQWVHVDLEPFEFLRRFLQHVLPSGFHRVRRFGWLHPAGRRAFNRVRALLHLAPVLTPAEQTTWLGEDNLEPPDPAPTDTPPSPRDALPRCPRCRQPMVWVGSWHAGQTPLTPPERAPP
jgi:hypothetical protein